jgi:tRNA-2-methylthio-N6-dimethylallyladenosine synthase
MRFFIKTFGCQMNVHDSSRITEILLDAGYQTADSASTADLVLVNTCSVREKAWHKAISAAGRMCVLKRKNPEMVVVMAGCVAEQEGETWFKKLSGLDLVVGPDHYAGLPKLIDEVRRERGKVSRTGFDQGKHGDFLKASKSVDKRPPSAFVTVMKGCSEACNYCIVPTVRGPARSREADEIVAETELLVKQGVREVMLLGQKVNAYHPGQISFAGLLERLDGIPGLSRLRFTSPHPRHMTKELINAFGCLETLCESIHLPVQSGSDRILERMGRRYRADFYRDVAAQLKQACPSILISTDLIVGYPGETEADFEETVRLVEDVGFAGAFSFKYSPRPGTKAAQLPDDVPAEEKSRRLAYLHDVIERLEREVRVGLVGTQQEVLVEGRGRNPGQWTGRARNSQIINFIPDEDATPECGAGQFVQVKVSRALPHSLEGVPAS